MILLRVLAAAIAVVAALPALAQTQPLYTEQPATPLDKNFGLPTLGMPGSELPQQKTMAPLARTQDQPDFFKSMPTVSDPAPGTSDEPDFFQRPPDTILPRTPISPSSSYSTTMETPLFTTSQGQATDSTTGGMTTGRLGTDD